jgi:hypothetical protein
MGVAALKPRHRASRSASLLPGTVVREVGQQKLLATRICDLNIRPEGILEESVAQVIGELQRKGITFVPAYYLGDDDFWTADRAVSVNIPWYLANPELWRLVNDHLFEYTREEVLMYLRHEAGHAINYAFHLHERPDFGALFGDYARPYHERYAANPLSRAFVRHILGWYAQKHPDEDFAETFAVWLTPTMDWRTDYAGWEALRKLEWMDRVMSEVGPLSPAVPDLTDDDLPVSAMHWTVGEHYADDEDALPLDDARQFDGDLLRVFARPSEAPQGEPAARFLSAHEGELVTRIAYWTGEGPGAVRALIRALRDRAARLDLRVSGLEAATLIELTAFGTAVMMHWRYARVFRGTTHEVSR